MGQKLFNYISGQCDTLAATSSPGIDTIGLHIILALATIMMVWFGVQEALSAAQGGPGFNMAKFLNFFLLITFAYSMVKFYDSSIPGLGFSLKSFVIQGTDNLQQIIGTDANDQMLASIDNALAGSGTSTPTLNIFSGLYVAVCYVMAQLCLIVLDAVCALILSYGAVAGTIVGMLGPIFIPFMVFEKTEFLFLGLAEGLPQLRILQGCCRRNALACGAYVYVAGDQCHTDIPGSDQRGQSVSYPASADYRERVNHSQNSSDHRVYLLRQRGRPRRRRRHHHGSRHAGNPQRLMMAITEQTEAPEITRAAQRYVEQYGDPLVTNTYLKITILVLGFVCVMLGLLTFKSMKALASAKPFIVRINDVGRAEAIDYRAYEYKPQEAENKYYLSRWASLYFSRNRYTIERDQTQALYFLNSDVQQAVIREEQKDKTIATFQGDVTQPYVDVEIKNVILDDLRQSPYSARIEFDKVFTTSADHAFIKRESWTASVTYVFADHVANDALQYNPLGLTIVRYRADQAFTAQPAQVPAGAVPQQ